MLTSSFEMIKLQRIIYINIYEITELAMSCTLVRNFTYLLVDTGMPLSAPSPQGNHTRTQSDFNSVCEKRQTVLCISVGIGRFKHLQNRKMRLKLAASLMCLCFYNFSTLPRDTFLDWYPILMHMVDSLVPNSVSKLSVQ